MFSDIDYRATLVERACGSDAMRDAVLTPCLGIGWPKQGVQRALDRLRASWRRRVMELREAGWAPAQGAGFVGLRNCPPFGVQFRRTSPRTQTHQYHSCQRASICPFCYARLYVLKPLLRCRALLFNGNKPRPGLFLIEFHTELRFQAVEPRWTPALVRDGLPLYLDIAERGRKLEFGIFSASGGAVLQHFVLRDGKAGHDGKAARNACGHVRRSGLLVTANPQPLPVYGLKAHGLWANWDRVRVHEAPTLETLTEAASRAYRYPASLLHRLDPAVTVALLKMIGHSHLLRLYPRG